MSILITETLSNNSTLANGGGWLFPAGGSNIFSLTCKRLNSSNSLETVDISTATEVITYIVDRTADKSEVDNAACASGYSGADWANGVVAGIFDNASTALIAHRGYADIVVKVTIGGEPEYYYSGDKAVKIVSIPS